ncbi:uncharacterized protein LOC143775001 [Ranitomeya variabilis]|uniref:uncharacterized protein LOC143775001 n=1 Tax=Ranitomeya variabilis TaxID=490064 RepID=UPI004057A7AA
MLLQQRRRRRLWIHPINQLRMTRGVQSTLYLELRHNPHKFHNYVRMRIEHFDFLLAKLEDVIRRQDTRMRLAITPAERLMVTLRFLATGESMTSLHYQFRLGISTISGIVKDTCRAVWTTLQPEYIPQPSMEIWLQSAEEFQQICNFPNCVGAVDGKHIRIAKPAGTGSEYYNYKKYFSIVLMAIADANCRFLAVDIGAYGRSNDSQVLKNSPMGRCLYGESYDLPPARPLPGTNDPAMEYVFVGDEAFQLSPHLLKPYSSRNLNHTKRVFNYRLTRARRVVECSFGILTAKWRVLLTAIKLKTTTIDEVVKAFFPSTLMDFRARDRTWRAQLNEVFHDSIEGGNDGPSRELQETITRFKDLLHKRTRIWWNHEFLDKYIQKDLIPRGLRIQVFPSFPIEDEEFKGKWEDLINNCSKGFMVLLKQMNQKSLECMEIEIDGLQATLHKDMTGDSLKKLNDGRHRAPEMG